MTMIQALKRKVKTLPFHMEVVAEKDTARKYQATLMFDGDTSVVDLQRACAPGMAGRYCWQVICTAMLDIYQSRGDKEKARLWLDAVLNPKLITKDNY